MTQDKDLQVLNTTLDNVLAPYLEQINKLSDFASKCKHEDPNELSEKLPQFFREINRLQSQAEFIKSDFIMEIIPYLVSVRYESAKKAKGEYEEKLGELWTDIASLLYLCNRIDCRRTQLSQPKIYTS